MNDRIGSEVWIIIHNVGKIDVFTDGEYVLLKKVKIDGIKFCEGNNLFYTSGNLSFTEGHIQKDFDTALNFFNKIREKI